MSYAKASSASMNPYGLHMAKNHDLLVGRARKYVK